MGVGVGVTDPTQHAGGSGHGEMDDLLYMPSLPDEDKEEPHA